MMDTKRPRAKYYAVGEDGRIKSFERKAELEEFLIDKSDRTVAIFKGRRLQYKTKTVNKIIVN